MVMFIFFILLIFGVVFYAKMSMFGAQRQKQENIVLGAIQIEQKVKYLPELQCTSSGDVVSSCYDLGKVDAFANVYGNHISYYRNLLGTSSITITQVYPDEMTYTVFTGNYSTATSSQPFRTPVALFDPVSDTYNFGYITIEVFR